MAAALSMVCTKKNKEASVNISKTASPPKKHNASLWRLNVADCVCWRIWKEGGGGVGGWRGGGGGGRMHVMFKVNLIVTK